MQLVVASHLLVLSHAHHSGNSLKNVDLGDHCAEALNRVFNQFVLLAHELFLLNHLKLYLWKQLISSLALILLDLGHDLIHGLERLWLMHLDIVLLEHILTESDALEGFVALADVLGKKKLVGLNVRVNVDVVYKIKFEELIYRFPVLVALDRNLEETHSLRTELTHYY